MYPIWRIAATLYSQILLFLLGGSHRTRDISIYTWYHGRQLKLLKGLVRSFSHSAMTLSTAHFGTPYLSLTYPFYDFFCSCVWFRFFLISLNHQHHSSWFHPPVSWLLRLSNEYLYTFAKVIFPHPPPGVHSLSYPS